MRRTALAIIVAAALSSCSLGHYPIDNPKAMAGLINISMQPSWGPAGYDYAMFYYFPDFNFYYDVTQARFYYKNYGRWVWARSLPVGRGFPSDLHRYYKVVINTPSPWLQNRRHRSIYKQYRGVTTQQLLFDVWGGNRPPQSAAPTPPTRRIPSKASTPPARNNNSLGAGARSQGSRKQGVEPQTSRPQGSQQGVGQGSRRNNTNRQGVTTGSQSSASKSAGSSGSQSSGSRTGSGSKSGGTRSSGSRGR